MNNIKVEVESPENASTSRKRQLETEPQTPREKKKLTLDDQYEKLIKIKLKFVEKNKGEIPALHFAARVSDVDVCRRLVEQGADVNEKCVVRGATPLHYAALNAANGYSLIEFFLEKGCNFDEQDAHHDKAINYALRVENFKLAMRMHMLSQKRNPGKASICNVLRFCLMQNSLNFAKFLYNNKRCEILSELPSHFAMLDTACQFGDLEMCKWLLEEVKIDVNQCKVADWKDKVRSAAARNRKNEASKILPYLFSRFQFTADQQKKAYLSAILYKLLEDVIFCANELEELFKRVAVIKIKLGSKNFLQLCVSRNRLEAAKFVHEKDGDLINEINGDGTTTLHLAAQLGDVEICQWLIDQGQDINAVNKQTFANFLHYSAQNRLYGDSIIQEFGHNLRGIVNQIDENVYTPLHYAILNERQHENVAEALLELGADLSVKRKGNNFLHFCIVMGKLECAKFVHAKDKNQIKEKGEGGKTTLHLAADNFNEEICAWLVRDEGADPQEITVGGKSVLESTSSEEAKKCLQSLITTK